LTADVLHAGYQQTRTVPTPADVSNPRQAAAFAVNVSEQFLRGSVGRAEQIVRETALLPGQALDLAVPAALNIFSPASPPITYTTPAGGSDYLRQAQLNAAYARFQASARATGPLVLAPPSPPAPPSLTPPAPPPAELPGLVSLEAQVNRALAERDLLPQLQSLRFPMAPQALFEPSPNAFLLPGETTMTIMKGTIQFNGGGANGPQWGGWSESCYSDVPTESPSTMMDKMIKLLGYRMKLSIGPDNPKCQNAVVPYAIKVEDELVLRDSLVRYCIQPGGSPLTNGVQIPPSYATVFAGYNPATINAYNQNLDLELGARVKFQAGLLANGTGAGQVATPMFHGMPILGFANNTVTDPGAIFNRQSAPIGTWLNQLNNMTSYMATAGLGYRNIGGAWYAGNNNGAASTPYGWYYNTQVEMIEFQWLQKNLPGQTFDANGNPSTAGVAPFLLAGTTEQAAKNWPQIGSKIRVKLSGWKSFPVLNGRFAAQVVIPQPTSPALNPYTPVPATPYVWALRILRKVRMPQDGSLPFVNPIAWTAWWPGESFAPGPVWATPNTAPVPPASGSSDLSGYLQYVGNYQYIESKKLGRFFGAERGRQRNRAS
jgi:hypothetical protein